MLESPECRRVLTCSIGALLALGTAAAGIVEVRESPSAHLSVQAAGVVVLHDCLVDMPVTLVCIPETTTSTTTTIKPVVESTVPSTVHTTGGSEATQGLQTATTEEIRYLACISLKESTNNPAEYNAAGPYYGKYQFHQDTWDGFVASIGLHDLVGIDIRTVSEPVQDYVALRFLRANRQSEWGPNRLCLQG